MSRHDLHKHLHPKLSPSRHSMRFAFAITLAGLSTGACAQGGGSIEATGVEQNSCVAAAGSTSKVQLENLASVPESDQGASTDLKKGTPVTVVVRDGCVSSGLITSTLTDRFDGMTRAGIRSYTWNLPKDLTIDELSDAADADACVDLVTDANEVTLDPEENTELAASSTTSPPVEAQSEGMSPMAVTQDPLAASQSHLRAINAYSANDVFYNEDTGIKTDVVIAIIDSGVRLNHEDLKANIWRNVDEIPNNGIDDDKNGYVDDAYGYNFPSRISSPEPQVTAANSAWQWAHGTKVAGLAAAVSNNGRGGSGVMGTARIMALNAMGRSSGFAQSNVANAIRYAVDNGAHVINLSLGGSPASADFRNALAYAVNHGVVVLAAAGNEASRISASYSAAGQASSLAGLLSIANLKATDLGKSTTSNYSSTYVELGAPGTTTIGSGLMTTSPSTLSSYAAFSGTSAATPVAAGGAALAIGLIKSRGYLYSAGAIERLLLASAKKVSGLTSYIVNGNAMDLATLAAMINASYPVRPDYSESEGTPVAPPSDPNAGKTGGAQLPGSCD